MNGISMAHSQMQRQDIVCRSSATYIATYVVNYLPDLLPQLPVDTSVGLSCSMLR